MNLDARPVHRAGLVNVPIDGETIVVDEEAARLHHLDALATAVWVRLDGSATLREVSAALANAFAAPAQQIEADVHALVDRLVDDGLLDMQ